MARGFNPHSYTVASFQNGLTCIEREFATFADECARTGEMPSQAIDLPIFFDQLSDFMLPFPIYLVPAGFPRAEYLDVDDMFVAGDYWEERGAARKSEVVRTRGFCIVRCQSLLDWAIDEWRGGHPEQPGSWDLINEIVNELVLSRFLQVPYGVYGRSHLPKVAK